ncbi:nitroreductase family protein [Candidatus Bipolaricaulota bacterium]
MDAIEAILTRRSIRSFRDEPVPEELIETLLRAAMAAPSAGNQQPWQFVVVRDRAVLDRIPTAHPHAQMATEAPLAIVVCGDTALEKHKGFWIQDCSAAVENLLVAAHASGLGAVWCGVYPSEERVAGVRELLAIPEHVVPLALLVMGHPNEEKPPSERYEETRIHSDRWTS